MKPISIAIVGSGLSALSFVKNLLSNTNYFSAIDRITLFEKSRGVGGRMATRRVTMDEESTIYFDHGAQYFTARDELFKDQVNQWLDQKQVMLWNDPIVSLESDFTIKQKSARQGSLSDVSSSVESVSRYISTSYGMNAICKFMKSEILNIAANSNIAIKFEMENFVKTLSKDSEGKWKIGLIDSTIENNFDLVIISCPPEQSAQLLKTTGISNNRVLDKVEKMEMHPCWSMMISFPKKLHQSTIKGGAFVNVDCSISWICNQSSRNIDQNRETWVIHASKNWSTHNLEKSIQEVQQVLYSDFVKLLMQFESKDESDIILETADHISVHRWRYSIPFSTNPIYSTNEWHTDGIACIGDWTQQGRIEGAYMSGKQMADFLISKL